MHKLNYPSITKFQELVELKDYRKPTKKEYVRYVRKLAEHFQCDPATLTEDQLRQYFIFLREHKHYSRSPMKMAKYALLAFFVILDVAALSVIVKRLLNRSAQKCSLCTWLTVTSIWVAVLLFDSLMAFNIVDARYT